MHDVADVNPDFEFDPPVGSDVTVALGQDALDFDGALGRFQGAAEFHEKGVANRFDFHAVKRGKISRSRRRCSSSNSRASWSSRWDSAL